MTPFEAALKQFENYAWSLDPAFGQGVSEIILRDYVQATGHRLGGLGEDAPTLADYGETNTPEDYLPGTLGPSAGGGGGSSAQQGVLASLGDFIERVSGSVIKTGTAYYTTQAQLRALKQQAQQPRQVTRADFAAGGVSSMMMLAGVALVGVLMLSNSGRGRR
jgi:hypothetical protein